MKYSGLALPNTVYATTQASKGVCSHLISSLKDETNFETAKHTQTTAAEKQAIRISRDSLHERELSHITDPLPAATKRTILRSQETGEWLQTPQVTSMELAFLKWNSKMHCPFDIVEHHPISPLTAMVVEQNSPWHMDLSARKED